jgi:putative ABC transport system permease protein
VHVPGRLLIVPIMVVGGLTVLAARLAVLYLRRGGPRRTPRSPAAFLGWRRIGRQAVMTAVLAGATSVPIALAAYGATVTGSVRTTIADESRLRIGSDVVLTLNQRTPIPASLAGQATEVLRLDGAMIGGVQTDLLAVDPDSFARDAYWDDRLDGASLSRLMDPIRGPSAGDTGIPRRVVAAARAPSGQQGATWGGDAIFDGQVDVVPTFVLPAQRTGYPLALVPKDALGGDTKYAVVQWWVRGDPAKIRAAVVAAKLPVKAIQSATGLYANTLWEPLTYTFDYLTALSLLTGVVTLVGLLLYLESQAPLHRRAYVLLRRMGLSARSHRRAILGELALPLLAGLVGGVAVAAGLTAVLGADFEMNPGVPPDTVIAVPYLPLGLIAAAVALIAFGAARYAQARIGRANPSEVLRDAI